MTVDNTGSGEVFIVDDDPLVLNALSIVLSRAGYQVTGFAEGASFLAAAPDCTFTLGRQPTGPPKSTFAPAASSSSWATIRFSTARQTAATKPSRRRCGSAGTTSTNTSRR